MNKTYEVIKIDEELSVVVDKQDRDTYSHFCIGAENNKLFICTSKYNEFCWKVITTIDKDMREQGIPLIVMPDESVKYEELIGSKAMDFCIDYHKTNSSCGALHLMTAYTEGFVDGYETKEEIYTKEDIIKGKLEVAESIKLYLDIHENSDQWIDEIVRDFKEQVQSLQKKKVIKAVVLEMKTYALKGEEHMSIHRGIRIKINPDNTITPIEVIYESI